MADIWTTPLFGVPQGRLAEGDKRLKAADHIPEYYYTIPTIRGRLDRSEPIPGLGSAEVYRAFGDQFHQAMPQYQQLLENIHRDRGAESAPPNMGIDTFSWQSPVQGAASRVVSAWSPSYRDIHSELAAAARSAAFRDGPQQGDTDLLRHLPELDIEHHPRTEEELQGLIDAMTQRWDYLEPNAPQHIYSVFPTCQQPGCAPFFGGTEDRPGVPAQSGFLPNTPQSAMLYSVPLFPSVSEDEVPNWAKWGFLQRHGFAKGGLVKKAQPHLGTTLNLLRWLKSVG